MSIFQDIVGVVETGVGAATGNPALASAGASTLTGQLTAGNANDPKRAAAATAALAKATAGSVPDAIYMIGQRIGSATAYGKQQFEIAWQKLLVANPQVAAEALKQYPQVDPVNTPSTWKTKLASEWDSLVNKIKQDVGTTVQQVGSGVTTAAATKIDPNTGRITLPLSSSMIWIVAIGVLAIAAVFLLSKKK
jgi:uncharacterized protein YjbJ (UPF0337 family)